MIWQPSRLFIVGAPKTLTGFSNSHSPPPPPFSPAAPHQEPEFDATCDSVDDCCHHELGARCMVPEGGDVNVKMCMLSSGQACTYLHPRPRTASSVDTTTLPTHHDPPHTPRPSPHTASSVDTPTLGGPCIIRNVPSYSAPLAA
jgi:hypothetical protein